MSRLQTYVIMPTSDLRRTTQTRILQATQWSPAIALKVADGVAALQLAKGAARPRQAILAEAEENLALSAERVLLTALEAKDLRVERTVRYRGARNMSSRLVGVTGLPVFS
jgi:hypothetical protein